MISYIQLNPNYYFNLLFPSALHDLNQAKFSFHIKMWLWLQPTEHADAGNKQGTEDAKCQLRGTGSAPFCHCPAPTPPTLVWNTQCIGQGKPQVLHWSLSPAISACDENPSSC